MASSGTENSDDITIEYCEKSVFFKWTINNFKELDYEQKRLLSPRFTTSFLGTQLEWTLACWRPRGPRLYSSDYVSFGLFTRNKIRYTCEIRAEGKSAIIEVDPEENYRGIPNLLHYSKVYSKNLEVYFKITVKIDKNYNDKSELIQQIQKEQLLNSIKVLFKNKIDSDVKLVSTNCEIPAHKCILSARSEVFKAMFSSGMKECLEKEVKIEDIDDDVLEGMVEYIYTGTSSKLTDIAVKLIVAADKYGLDGLKILCEGPIIENLSTENIWNCFVLAEQYKLKKLMDACLDLWSKNRVELCNSEFDEIIRTKPELIKAIIQHNPVYHIDEWIDLELQFLQGF